MGEAEMVERVALKIWHERAKHFGEPAKPFVKDERWELCLSYARAAIEAIREPTEEMRNEGWDVGRAMVTSYGFAIGGETPVWQAMIEAALVDPSPPVKG